MFDGGRSFPAEGMLDDDDDDDDDGGDADNDDASVDPMTSATSGELAVRG